MLTEAALAYLSKDSPLRPFLIEAAWASLSTESKLQVIDAIVGARNVPTVPDFLTSLALIDDAPIVRYWVASLVTDPEWRDRILKDSSALVRASAEHGNTLSLDGLSKVNQLARLCWIRSLRLDDHSGLAAFVDESVKENSASHEDIGECIEEYFRGDAFKRSQREPEEMDSSHFFAEASRAQGARELWGLASSVPKRVQLAIAWNTPLAVGIFRLTVDTILKMTPRIQGVIAWREGEEASLFREFVRRRPAEVDGSVVKTVALFDKR